MRLPFGRDSLACSACCAACGGDTANTREYARGRNGSLTAQAAEGGGGRDAHARCDFRACTRTHLHTPAHTWLLALFRFRHMIASNMPFLVFIGGSLKRQTRRHGDSIALPRLESFVNARSEGKGEFAVTYMSLWNRTV